MMHRPNATRPELPPDADVRQPNAAGQTWLHKAAIFNNVCMASAVLDRDPSTVGLANAITGEMPAHTAAQNDAVDVLRLFGERHPEALSAVDAKFQALPVIFAVRNGRVAATRFLMEATGADVNRRNKKQQTMLMEAAAAGQASVIDLLIREFNAPLASTNLHGWTALHFASRSHRNTDAVPRLIAADAPHSARDKNGWGPLHLAAVSGTVETAKRLVEAGADVGAADNHGLTPLFLAINKRRPALVSQLLQLGADVAATAPDGRTALEFAASVEDQDVNVMALLEDWGATRRVAPELPVHESARAGDLSAIGAATQEEVNQRDGQGRGPLHVARTAEVVQALLRAGTTPSPDFKGQTPLHAAAVQGSADAAGALLEAHPGLIQAVDHHHWNVFHFAADAGNADMVLRLAELTRSIIGDDAAVTAAVCAKGNIGNTPLHRAASLGHPEAVGALCQLGADLGAVNSVHGRSPLMMAIASHREEAALALVAAVVDRQQQDLLEMRDHRSGRTALLIALAKSMWEVARALILAGADCTATGKHAETALHVACGVADGPGQECCPSDVVAMLLEGGAKGDAINDINATPLLCAARCASAEVVDLLVRRCGVFLARKADGSGRLPLHWAAADGRHDIVARLVEAAPATATRQDNVGRTALHYAAMAGQLAAVAVIVHAVRGDTQIPSCAQGTFANWCLRPRQLRHAAPGAAAVMREAGGGYMSVIRKLEGDGVTVHAHIIQKAADAAVPGARRSAAVAAVLLAAGVEAANMADKAGDTPLHLAASCGNADVARLLMDSGAGQAPNHQNRTPAIIAADEGFDDVAAMLGAAAQ